MMLHSPTNDHCKNEGLDKLRYSISPTFLKIGDGCVNLKFPWIPCIMIVMDPLDGDPRIVPYRLIILKFPILCAFSSFALQISKIPTSDFFWEISKFPLESPPELFGESVATIR